MSVMSDMATSAERLTLENLARNSRPCPLKHEVRHVPLLRGFVDVVHMHIGRRPASRAVQPRPEMLPPQLKATEHFPSLDFSLPQMLLAISLSPLAYAPRRRTGMRLRVSAHVGLGARRVPSVPTPRFRPVSGFVLVRHAEILA